MCKVAGSGAREFAGVNAAFELKYMYFGFRFRVKSHLDQATNHSLAYVIEFTRVNAELILQI